MAVKDISPKTKDSVLQLTGSFGPKGIVSTIMKSSKVKKDDNFSFSGRAKVIKTEGKSASKITPLKEGNELIDMLLKIYSFMEKSHTEDVVAKEKENNFKEEKEFESRRKADSRHKLLLDALAKLRSQLNTGAAADTGAPGFSFPNIPNFPNRSRTPGGSNKGKPVKPVAPGEGKYRDPKTGRSAKKPTATKVSKILTGAKTLLGKLKGIPLLSTLTAGASMIFNIEEAIQKNEAGEIDDTELKRTITKEIAAALSGVAGAEIGAAIGTVVGGPIGALVGGVGGFAVGQIAGAQVAEKLFDYYTNDNITTKVNPMTENDYDAQGNVIGEKQSMKEPTSLKSVPVTPKDMLKLERVQSENNTLTLQPQKDTSTTVNNVVPLTEIKKSNQLERVPVPAVRNQEETFQKMIYYSTRVV